MTAAMVTALTIASAQPVAADIIVTSGVSNQNTDNVLLTDAADVDIVSGTLNSGLYTVNFESVGGNLNADASGQAVVTASHEPFRDISFYLTDGALFTKAVFNLNSAGDGTIVVKVVGVNISGGVYESTFAVDGSGQNFLTISAVNLQYMNSITLSAMGDVTFEDLRQVRIGGVHDDAFTPVPEPGSLLLLGSGFIAAGASAWRRRKRS